MSVITIGHSALRLAGCAAGVLIATLAYAGGNGNGGSGSGGAHGAATSGMTYHSEPVDSPWNRPVGVVKNDGNEAGVNASGAPRQDVSQQAKLVQ